MHKRVLKPQRLLRVGVWNSRHAFFSPDSQLLSGACKHCIDILTIPEAGILPKRFINGKTRQGFAIYCSPPSQGSRLDNVAVALGPNARAAFRSYHPISSRILRLDFSAPRPVTVIAVYAPQSGRPAEERSAFLEQLHDAISKVPLGHTLLVCGDFNAKLGQSSSWSPWSWHLQPSWQRSPPSL